MTGFHCPGQDMRYWRPDDISEGACPRCGEAIEFWKDDPRRRCPSCGAMVVNPNFDMGCAKWCQFADRCLGAGAVEQAEPALCDALIEQMKRVFADDARRIRHALAVLDYAEKILLHEQADPLVVKAAAVLHDIGVHAAREILERLGVDEGRAEHVCRIIAEHHSAGTIDTPEFRIVRDAGHLVNLFDESPGVRPAEAEVVIGRAFRTAGGRDLARRRLGREDAKPDARSARGDAP